MGWLQGQVGAGLGGASEVVAESWGRVVGGENVLEAAFSCIDATREALLIAYRADGLKQIDNLEADSAYLYGLAVGVALGKGGAR